MVHIIELPELSPYLPPIHLPPYQTPVAMNQKATPPIQVPLVEHHLNYPSNRRLAQRFARRPSSHTPATPKATPEHHAPYGNAIHLSGLTPPSSPFCEPVYAHEFVVTPAHRYPYGLPSPPPSPQLLPKVVNNSRPAHRRSPSTHRFEIQAIQHTNTNNQAFRGGHRSSLDVPSISKGDAQAYSPYRRSAPRVTVSTKVESIQGASSRPDGPTVARRGSPPHQRTEEGTRSSNGTHTNKRVRFAAVDEGYRGPATCMQVRWRKEMKTRKAANRYL